MDISFYEQQMKRLKSQWDRVYTEERMKIFYNAFRDVSNFDFRDAVTDCLSNCRGAPLLKELTEAIERARANYFNNKRIDEATQKNAFLNIPNGGMCDVEFKNKCVELYNSFVDKKISRDQFYQGCDLLDQAAKLFKKTYQTISNLPEKYLKPVFEDDKPF